MSETDIKKVMAKLNKRYGEGTIKLGGMENVEKVPTGIMSIDRLYQGGLARGRFNMIFGAKGTCKSTLCDHIAGVMQKQGEDVVIIDAENTRTPDYAISLGLDPDKAFYHRPQTLEEMCTAVNDFAPHVGLIIVDSIVSISSEQELDAKEGFEANSMALIPRKLSQFFRMTMPTVGKSNCVVILVNQIRTAGIGGLYTYDSYPGGHALSHYCTTIVQTSRGNVKDNPKDDNNKDIGFTVRLKLAKTKVSNNEGATATFTYLFEEPHLDPVDDLFRVAAMEEVIDKGGAWYSFGETKAQGAIKFTEEMRKDRELFEAIKNELR